MVKYHVRDKDMNKLIQEVREKKLILSPYFQRNLVWRDVHKKDFIETILEGLPFPQLFIAQGDLDVDTMESISCLVDGQQRMNAIMEFADNKLVVKGKSYSDLTQDEKTEFLRYQVPIIDLEISANDPQIGDIFQRLNRTFYALSGIEKLASEYATVDIMLIAQHACGLINSDMPNEDEAEIIQIQIHPLFPDNFIDWSKTKPVEDFKNWVLENGIFSSYEISRIVHLQYTLNLISTISYGFFARNDQTLKYLKAGANEVDDQLFKNRDEILHRIEETSNFLLSIELPASSMWWSKANSFTLFIFTLWNYRECTALADDFQAMLIDFEERQEPEGKYKLAAKESINNRPQRILRHQLLCEFFGFDPIERPLD